MAFDQKPDSEIPRFDPMHAPCGMGYRDEFRGAAGKTIRVFKCDNEDLWRLREPNVPFSHGFAHWGVGLSALVDPCTETMRRVAYSPYYQGYTDIECLVWGIQITLDYMMDDENCLKENDVFSKNKIADLIREMMIYQATRGFIGDERKFERKASYYLGKATGNPIIEIRREFSFNNNTLYHRAKALATERCELETWESSMTDGEFYVASDGQRNYYRSEVIDFENDPGIEIMIQRNAGMLYELRDRIAGQKMADVCQSITDADMYEAMKRGSDIPDNRYFEERFFGREEVCNVAPAMAAE